MPKQYYSFDEYSIGDSDDDRYSYGSEKSEKVYSSCRCHKCNKPKKCKPVKECYSCRPRDKCHKKSSKCYNSEEKCIIIKIRPCK